MFVFREVCIHSRLSLAIAVMAELMKKSRTSQSIMTQITDDGMADSNVQMQCLDAKERREMHPGI